MKWILLFFFFLPQLAFAQEPFAGAQIFGQLENIVRKLPANIYETHKFHPKKLNGSKFDSIARNFEEIYQALATKAGKKSLWLNAYADPKRGNTGGQFFEPVNSEMETIFQQGLNKFEDLNNKYFAQFSTRYKGKYKPGSYLVVWDSIYKARRHYLSEYGSAIIQMAKAEVDYLNQHKNMLTSSNEAERIQHYEAQAKVLTKLQSLNGALKFVIVEEGAAWVEMCKAYPETCRKYEKM